MCLGDLGERSASVGARGLHEAATFSERDGRTTVTQVMTYTPKLGLLGRLLDGAVIRANSEQGLGGVLRGPESAGRTRASMTPGERFAELADRYVASGPAEHGTMMGFPCLRHAGTFFASHDARTEALIVKLPASRVAVLIDAGSAQPGNGSGQQIEKRMRRVLGCKREENRGRCLALGHGG